MAPTNRDLGSDLAIAQAALDACAAAVTARRMDVAAETARTLLSSVSRLNGRLAAIADVLASGYAAAEVDRALKIVEEK